MFNLVSNQLFIFILFQFISFGSSSDLYFVNKSDYLLVLPKILNANKLMNIYSLCNFDNCKITFLFQCLKFEKDYNDETSEKLIDVYDLAVFNKNLIENQLDLISFDLPNLEPNLERCFKTDLTQELNRLALEIHIQFRNNLNVVNQNILKHKFDLVLSSFCYVKIIPTSSVYKNGQVIKFVILPFNLNLKQFTQTVQIKLLLPNKLAIKQWSLNYFSNDQLNQFEYQLSDRPVFGLYTIEVTVLNQIFKKSFFVLKYQSNYVEVFVDFKDHLLINQDSIKGSIIIKNLHENSETYFIKCSIYLVFKDFVEKQEVQTQLVKFTINQVTIENILELNLNYLLDTIDRSKLNEFLDPKYDLKRQVYLKVQADLYCKNEDCLLTNYKQTGIKNIRLIQKSKYIYCPKQLQTNHSSPKFTIQIKCWLIKLIDDESIGDDNSMESTQSNENKSKEPMEDKKPISELIVIQIFVRTYSNIKVPFKTIYLKTVSNLIRFDLNVLEKFSESDLKNILSLELELKLDNDYRTKLIIHFKHQNLFKNLFEKETNPNVNFDISSNLSSNINLNDLIHINDNSFNLINHNNEPGYFELKINRFEARINETVIVHIESLFSVRNMYLFLMSSGQLLNVQSIDTKHKSIRIDEKMFPYLDLIACAKLNNRIIYSKTSLKINQKSSLNSKFSQMLTSFNKMDNSSKIRIKLWTVSDSFIHMRSIKKDLDHLQENLNLIINPNDDLINFGFNNLDNKKDDFSLISSCFLIQELLDKCINYFKFTEPEMNLKISLSTTVDSLFLNQTKKPFYFEIFFFNETLVQFIDLIKSRTLINSDFDENLNYIGTELFDKRNLTTSTYERTYTFSIDDEIKPETHYLDLIELDEKHYQLKRIAFKNLNQSLIKGKLLINNRLYLKEWTNSEIQINIDKNLIDRNGKFKILFKSDDKFKVSKKDSVENSKSNKGNKDGHYSWHQFEEFQENVKKKQCSFKLLPLKKGIIDIFVKIIYKNEVIELFKRVLVMEPGFKYNFFVSRSFELIENLGKSLFFISDLNQLIDPSMKSNLLKANGRISLINDILEDDYQKELNNLKQTISSSEQQKLMDLVSTSCYRIALKIATKFVEIESQSKIKLESLSKSVQEIELLFSLLYGCYNLEHGYFVHQLDQTGNLYLTAFIIDLIIQIKQNNLTKDICLLNDNQIRRSLKWIAINQLKQTEPKSIEFYSKLTRTSQVLITLCNYKSNVLDQFKDKNLSKNLDQNLFDLINQTILKETKLFSFINLSKLNNEFSSLMVYSLFKCQKIDLFKKFYFDLIRFYSKRLDIDSYYISLNRIYTQHPSSRDSNLKMNSKSATNFINYFNQQSIRPRSFDSSDTLVLLNTAVFLIMKLEHNDYDESLDKFYNFLNNHKLNTNEWTSELSSYYATRAFLELRNYYYQNTNNLRKSLNRSTKQMIYYKQIIGRNSSIIDLEDSDNLNKITKVSFESISFSKFEPFKEHSNEKLNEMFYFEFKKHKEITVLMTNDELMKYKQIYLNLNGVGHFKVNLEINCYFKNLLIESIPHVKAYNHQVDLKLIKNNLYNLTLCQRYIYDKTYTPLTVIQFHLPLQLSYLEQQEYFFESSKSFKIDYLKLDHLLNIELFNLNNTLKCLSIKLINDMTFKHHSIGFYYSKIYDFNSIERFNLTSGTIKLPIDTDQFQKNLGIKIEESIKLLYQLFISIILIKIINKS